MKTIVIKSKWLVKLVGLISIGIHGWHNAKATAVFPFVIVKDWKYATPVFVNHEKIHFAQQVETLFVGVFILKILEDVYSVFVLKKNFQERYLWRASEQEAYLHQENLDYLKTRKPFAFLKYLSDKKDIRFDLKRGSPYVVVS